MQNLKNDFFKQEILSLAKNLLNKYLILKINTQEPVITKIVEVEAYSHIEKASHSYKNKKTKRNQNMFLDAGHLYIYQTYGLYYCLNIVAEKKDIGASILIRAVEPINNIAFLQNNRPNKKITDLTNGPGKLCQALNITRKYNGIDLKNNKWFYLATNNEIEIDKFTIYKQTNEYDLWKAKKQNHIIVSCPRINIESAKEDKYLHWRFYLYNNDFVSKKLKIEL